MTGRRITDPMEKLISNALDRAGICNVTEGDPASLGLDFYLTGAGVHIEVKQFHSDRIAAQMARAPNVIAVQGRDAVQWLADLIERANRDPDCPDA